MPKKYNYFAIDAGFFKVRILLCFSNKEFQKILKDHDINIKQHHYINLISSLHIKSCNSVLFMCVNIDHRVVRKDPPLKGGNILKIKIFVFTWTTLAEEWLP